MRLVVHDYSGHPGQIRLSRELARRGHHVQHQFCGSFVTGQGATQRRAGDPESFTILPIHLRSQFRRYSPIVRVCQEIQYGVKATRALLGHSPDLVVLSNVPLLSLLMMSTALGMCGVGYVFWQQDVYSEAIDAIARRRLGRIGGVIGWLAARCERHVARSAAAVVPISGAFVDELDGWGVHSRAIHVIPNWAAIDEMPLRHKDNAWARAHQLTDVPVVMYAGTLGWKHDPAAIADLARSLPSETRVLVVSQGKGREWLEERAGGISNLTLVDYQPYEQLPDVLATADVLLVLLERDASRYSVPSKVLNYLCAGRSILALLPEENAVSDTIAAAGAGLVVAPGDLESATAALGDLLSDPSRRQRMGIDARNYAERNFDIVNVGDRFDTVFSQSISLARRSGRFTRFILGGRSCAS